MNIFTQKIVGIEFNDYAIELVELKAKGKTISLESYNRVCIPTGIIKNGEIAQEEELKTIITELFNTANPTKIETKNTAILFPSSKVLTHIFTFPANLSEKDIRKALPYEAETIIPFSINDVYWDFSIHFKDEKTVKHASQYVLFACITKNIADKYTLVLEGAGLTPYLFGINAEAIKYALEKQTTGKKTGMIIDVGALSVNYLIVENGRTKYFLSSNENGEKMMKELARDLQTTESAIFAQKEKNKLGTTMELPQVKAFIEKNYKQAQSIIYELESEGKIGKVENIYITGEFLNLPNFFNLAKVYFPNQNIEIGNPKLGLAIDDKRFIPEEPKNGTAVPYSTYFVNAIGVALRGINGNLQLGINLLPESIKESFSNRKNTLFIAIGAILMSLIMLFTSTFLFTQYQKLIFERQNLEIKKSAIEKMIYGTRYQEIRDSITQFNNEIEILSKIDGGLFSVPDMMEKIEKLLPSGIETVSVQFNDADLSYSITGLASTREKLLMTRKNLERAEFISEVIAPISNYDEKSQTSFLMKIKLNFPKLAKYDSSTNTK